VTFALALGRHAVIFGEGTMLKENESDGLAAVLVVAPEAVAMPIVRTTPPATAVTGSRKRRKPFRVMPVPPGVVLAPGEAADEGCG